MSRLTQDGTAKPVPRDHILRRERARRGRKISIFPVQLITSRFWQPYSVDPYSVICNGHTYIHIHTTWFETTVRITLTH